MGIQGVFSIVQGSLVRFVRLFPFLQGLGLVKSLSPKSTYNQHVTKTNSTTTTIISRLFHLPGASILDTIYVPGQLCPVLFIWSNFFFGIKMSHPMM